VDVGLRRFDDEGRDALVGVRRLVHGWGC
jgi:hypothetical protein